MKVLFDSNLWISFMIGKRLSSLADVLCHHDNIIINRFSMLDFTPFQIPDIRFDGTITFALRLLKPTQSLIVILFVHLQHGQMFLGLTMPFPWLLPYPSQPPSQDHTHSRKPTSPAPYTALAQQRLDKEEKPSSS